MARRATRWTAALLVLTCLSGCVAWPISKRLQDLSLQSAPGLEAIPIYATPLPLTPADESETAIGHLRYRGGVKLSSSDARFGGFSGLLVSTDGTRLLALSDRALWLTAELEYTQGVLTGVAGGAIGPLLDGAGAPLAKPYYDSEGLTVDSGDPFDPSSDGSVLVSFETRDRVERYAFARDGAKAVAAPVPMPDEIKSNVVNKGLEGITRLADGRLLAITERTLDAEGNARGWIVEADGRAAPVIFKRKQPFELTDLARAPDGAVYTLERRFTRLAGPGMRIRRLDPATIRPGGLIDGEEIAELGISQSIDNMEGLAIRQDTDGKLLFYIISDDNGNSLQRTVLLMFELTP